MFYIRFIPILSHCMAYNLKQSPWIDVYLLHFYIYICVRLFLISRNRRLYLGKNKTTFTTFDIFACLIACRVSYRKSVGRRRPERKPTGDGATKQLPLGYHLGLIAVVVKQMSVVSDSFFSLLTPNTTWPLYLHVFSACFSICVCVCVCSITRYPLPAARYPLTVKRYSLPVRR